MSVSYDEKTKTWHCYLRYKDYTGVTKKKHKRGFARQKDAKEWERAFLEKQAATPSILFGSMIDLFLEDKKEHTKEITYETKRHRIDTWIRPYFGEKPTNEISAIDIRKWQADLKKAKQKKGDKPLSEQYMYNIYTELSSVFNFACRFYGLPVNPCNIAGNAIGHKQKSLQFWTKEEFDSFITSIAPSDEYYVIFNTLYYTGMRLGELQALTSADIDFDMNTINVNKTYKVLNGKELITTPKTKKAVRKIIIPQFLSDMLKSYIARLYKNSKTDRIFFQSQTAIARHLKMGAEAASVTPIRIHDLRHSHASLLIDLGFSAVLISERLGHENITTTLNIYSHLFPSKQTEVAEKLQNLYSSNVVLDSVTFGTQGRKQE